MTSLISDKQKAIFIHIPKTGGTSMTEYLYSESRYGFTTIMKYDAIDTVYSGLASKFKEFLPIHSWDTYFKFCFVRNPWDRCVSAWKMCLRNGVVHSSLSSFVKEPTRNIDPKWKRFVVWHVMMSHINQVTDTEGNIMVDFVGKYENIEEDFAFVCRKLNTPFNGLPHRNRMNARHYSEYYTEEAKRIIAERFKDDIAIFDYEFDGTTKKKNPICYQEFIKFSFWGYVSRFFLFKKLRSFLRSFLGIQK